MATGDDVVVVVVVDVVVVYVAGGVAVAAAAAVVVIVVYAAVVVAVLLLLPGFLYGVGEPKQVSSDGGKRATRRTMAARKRLPTDQRNRLYCKRVRGWNNRDEIFGLLGLCWGPLGALLGPSWGRPGAFLGPARVHLGSIMVTNQRV